MFYKNFYQVCSVTINNCTSDCFISKLCIVVCIKDILLFTQSLLIDNSRLIYCKLV